jgi:hypothetical protein
MFDEQESAALQQTVEQVPAPVLLSGRAALKNFAETIIKVAEHSDVLKI